MNGLERYVQTSESITECRPKSITPEYPTNPTVLELGLGLGLQLRLGFG